MQGSKLFLELLRCGRKTGFMITKVKKIKNLGIFHDYTAGPNTPDLNRYNLIYGWNGSGKTTISRLFCALESGESEQFPSLEYKLESADGTTVKHKQPYTEAKVMVFNQDYVHENAPSLDDPYTRTKHIYLLGKEDKVLAKQIEADKFERSPLVDEVDPKKKGSYTYRKKELDTTRTTLFKNTADTIAAIKGGTPIRNYNRTNAMAVYNSLQSKEELSDKELKSTRKVVDQQVLDDVTEVALQAIPITREGKTENLSFDDFLIKIVDSTTQTLNEKVQQELIARLKDNHDIADWVGQGIALHEEHKSKNCEYCGQAIPAARLNELAKHFNEAHAALVAKIDKEIKGLELLRARLNNLQLQDTANFYAQLHEEYEIAKSGLETEKR